VNIYWVNDDRSHPAQLIHTSSLNVVCVHGPDVFPPELDGIDAAVVHANAGRGRRAGRLGLKWVQGVRRELRSTIPILVYSYEAREGLQKEFSVLNDGIPGIGYLRLPWTPNELESVLTSLPPIGEVQLEDVIRWHTGLQELWRAWVHDLSLALPQWPTNKAPAEKIMRSLSESVTKFAPDQRPALGRLAGSLGNNTENIRAAIQALEDGLCRKPAEHLPPAPYNLPPRGYSTIAIADDQGYEKATVSRLREYGYDVGGVARNLEEGINLLRYWCPSVLLADLHLNSIDDGLELMNRALAQGCLVIVISRAGVAEGVVPDGVLDSSGGHHFQDADRLHRLIWRRALSEGISDHA